MRRHGGGVRQKHGPAGGFGAVAHRLGRRQGRPHRRFRFGFLRSRRQSAASTLPISSCGRGVRRRWTDIDATGSAEREGAALLDTPVDTALTADGACPTPGPATIAAANTACSDTPAVVPSTIVAAIGAGTVASGATLFHRMHPRTSPPLGRRDRPHRRRAAPAAVHGAVDTPATHSRRNAHQGHRRHPPTAAKPPTPPGGSARTGSEPSAAPHPSAVVPR